MSDVVRVEIPYAPRRWAQKLHASFHRWAVLVIHRRAGKTTAELNHHQRAAIDSNWERQRLRFLLPQAPEDQITKLMRNRIYWHVMPSLKQAKLVGWDMLKEIASVVPGHRVNNSDLEVTYPDHGYGPAKLRLLGADDPDSLRGPGLSGLSLDEFTQIPAKTFSEVLSKALADHLGYCIWSGTIQGKDQLYQLYESVKNADDWYAVWQNADVSLATEAGPTITALLRAMEDDRKLIEQGVITQDSFDQEWYLSSEAAIQGAWFGKEMSAAKKAGRITRVPYDPALPVDTDWDLGIDDNMSIWFSQSLRSGEVHEIDYYENSGEGFGHYIKVLREKPYIYGKHYPPHDIAVRELGTGKSRKETAAAMGLRFESPRPALDLIDGINAARLFIPKCWFDEENCKQGIECLRQYRKTLNARTGEFTGVPVHNWASHGADAYRGQAVRHKIPVDIENKARAPYRPASPYS